MGHTKINGTYWVKRSTHEKLKREIKELNFEKDQLTAYYSEVKMSFEKCAIENSELRLKIKQNGYSNKELLIIFLVGALFGAALFAAIYFSLSLKF